MACVVSADLKFRHPPRRPTKFTLQHHPINLKVLLYPLDSGLPIVLHEETVRLFITCVLTPLIPDVIDAYYCKIFKMVGLKASSDRSFNGRLRRVFGRVVTSVQRRRRGNA